MSFDPTTLVMAGSREAHGLITALVARGRPVIASLPEPDRMFGPPPVPAHVGGFASDDACAAWMLAHGVATVIDASHAFEADASGMAARVAARLSLRYLRLVRPPWTACPRDQWHEVPSIRAAVRCVPARGRVFSSTGRATLPDYAEFPGERLFLRQKHPAPGRSPYPFLEFSEGTPPFSQFQEQDLFERLAITHLICRNVGGAASMSKLLAARALAIPVLMVARQPLPTGLATAKTVAEALAWEALA
jgi:precorrin-6A/cobalt-precorrin-6A reductase